MPRGWVHTEECDECMCPDPVRQCSDCRFGALPEGVDVGLCARCSALARVRALLAAWDKSTGATS